MAFVVPGFLLIIITSLVLLFPLLVGLGEMRELIRRRVFRIQVFGQRLRIVISQYQAIAMLLAAVFVYTGSLIEASTYNRDCAYMRPQVPGFSGTDVLIGFLLLLPCLVLVRKQNWRVCLAGTSAMLVAMSAYYFKYAFGPIGCVNSGGMTDAYDAPGFAKSWSTLSSLSPTT